MMMRILSPCVLAFLILSTVLPAQLWATTFYLSLGGHGDTPSDANSCVQAQTITTPKATANSLITNCLLPGDTMYLRGGTPYNQRMDFTPSGVAHNGTAGNPITIAGYPGDPVPVWRYADPVLNDYGGIKAWGTSYLTFKDFIVDGSLYTFSAGVVNTATGWHINGGSHIILDNMEITGQPYNGLIIENSASQITVRNSRIHDPCGLACYGDNANFRWYGVYVHDGSTVLFEGNEIYANPGGGVQVYNSGGGGVVTSGITFRDNKIHHNGTYASSNVGGFVVGKGSSTTFTNLQFYNNLVYHNGGLGVTPVFAPCFYVFGSATSGLSVTGNTFYDCYHYSVFIESAGATANTFQNNIAYGTRNPVSFEIVDQSSGNIINHNLQTDPLFVNAAAFDLHLQSGSAAIDAGTDLSSIFTTDFDGTPRPQGAAYDIGAYEFGVSTIPSKFHPSRNTKRVLYDPGE